MNLIIGYRIPNSSKILYLRATLNRLGRLHDNNKEKKAMGLRRLEGMEGGKWGEGRGNDVIIFPFQKLMFLNTLCMDTIDAVLWTHQIFEFILKTDTDLRERSSPMWWYKAKVPTLLGKNSASEILNLGVVGPSRSGLQSRPGLWSKSRAWKTALCLLGCLVSRLCSAWVRTVLWRAFKVKQDKRHPFRMLQSRVLEWEWSVSSFESSGQRASLVRHGLCAPYKGRRQPLLELRTQRDHKKAVKAEKWWSPEYSIHD